MSPIPWKELEHTADVGIEVWGNDMEQVFKDSASAMYGIIFAHSGFAGTGEAHDITLEGHDLQDLAVLWLNELIYLIEVRNRIYRVASMYLDQLDLRLTTRGFLYPSPKVLTPLKAATFGGIFLVPSGSPRLRLYFDV
ncbi:MAG: archease [Synergistales bacterium]|nr:archease [Synergistales bacterium]